MPGTARVQISYRPLRIGWAIRDGDFDALRKAVRYNHCLWGGRFNPILVVDDLGTAEAQLEAFQVDVVFALGEGKPFEDFARLHAHLITPFHQKTIFNKGTEHSRPSTEVLDVHNALASFSSRPEWKGLKERGFSLYTWDQADDLADIFLINLGAYPDPAEIGTDYRAIAQNATEGAAAEILLNDVIVPGFLEHPSIAYLSRLGLHPVSNTGSGWNSPGFYVGEASSFPDVVTYWNLRACDIGLWFLDPRFLTRYSSLIPTWEKSIGEHVAQYRDEWRRKLALWGRTDEQIKKVREHLTAKEYIHCVVREHIWNGLNVRAPQMSLGEASTLGVLSIDDESKYELAFSLPERPYNTDTWFGSQDLVASVSTSLVLYKDEHQTFEPPYIPQLNEFYARSMHFHYDRLRIKPERVDLIVNAFTDDTFLRPLPVADLIERIFKLAGYKAKLSSAGLILRQLMSRLGGRQGARVFKIAGVRRLLRTHGPNAYIKKKAALQLIGSKDPDRPGTGSFDAHNDLFIEQRPWDEGLSAEGVFGFLVEKGLFRIGAALTCPTCRMESWIGLDNLQQEVACDLCGATFLTARMLGEHNDFDYRRSGILGAEKNAQGAIPVALTLQQLHTCLSSISHEHVYSPSLELRVNDEERPCELDFVVVSPSKHPDRTVIILGECRDQVPFTADEVSKVKKVAEALEGTGRFQVFLLFSKLVPFSAEEIELARALNNRHHLRAILLTARELEPYHVYHRTKEELAIEDLRGHSPNDMAIATAKIYFAEKKGQDKNAPDSAKGP